MRSNIFKYIFIIFVIGLLIFAYVKIKSDENNNNSQAQVKEKSQDKITEIRLGLSGFDTINPIFSKNKNTQEITKIIYEPLVNVSSDFKAEPGLAKEWAKQNATSYIIKLRENVKWANGERFTSADVIFTIEKLKAVSSIYSTNVEGISQVEVVDDYTIKLILNREIPFFEYNLNFPIMSKVFYDDKDFNDVNIVPMGTGMYSITEVKSNSIVLGKNTNWWNREKNLSLSKITITIYPSIGELYNSFKLGNIDVVSTANVNVQEYIGTMGYNLRETKGREHDFLALNTQNEFLSRQEVRKAISYSIDKSNITSTIYGNKYLTSSFPLDYGNWTYQEQDSSAGFNTEQAKQVLVDNGWEYKYNYWQKTENYKTQKIVLNLLVKGDDGTRVAVAENIRTQLENQGIRINITKLNGQQYYAALEKKSYDIVLCSMNLSISPDLTRFFGDGNLSNYVNEEVSNLMNEAKNSTDESRIKEIYKRLSEIYKTDIPYISLYNNKQTIAYNNSLVGELKPNWYSPYFGIDTWYK